MCVRAAADEVDHVSKKASDVYEVTDGEWLAIGAFRHHICCGCGMEHRVETRIHDGVMQERWTTTKQPRHPRRPRKSEA